MSSLRESFYLEQIPLFYTMLSWPTMQAGNMIWPYLKRIFISGDLSGVMSDEAPGAKSEAWRAQM